MKISIRNGIHNGNKMIINPVTTLFFYNYQ